MTSEVYFMESFHITDDFFESLENEISSTNQQLFNTMKGKDDFLYSVEFIKIAFSENLLDDIEFLNTLSGQPLFKARHANIILRDMLEQVIEFIYLMKHTELITEYMGVNVDTSKITTRNPIKGIHKVANDIAAVENLFRKCHKILTKKNLLQMVLLYMNFINYYPKNVTTHIFLRIWTILKK